MVETSSTMQPLGVVAPPFTLPDVVSGRTVRFGDFACNKALLVMFICNHCPYVVHVRDELVRIGRDYADENVGIVAINSNDVRSYPDDSPDRMVRVARKAGFTFPYCFDETQDVAKAYHAACTPDFFVFNAERKLVYRGQLDDSRPGNKVAVTGKDLRAAIDAALTRQPPLPGQKPSMGCNIKWRRGNEPDYFSHYGT